MCSEFSFKSCSRVALELQQNSSFTVGVDSFFPPSFLLTLKTLTPTLTLTLTLTLFNTRKL